MSRKLIKELVAFVRSHGWIPGALLALAIFLTYQHVWHAGFIWDDDSHLTKNLCIIGPLGFKEIWTTSAATYYPLVLSNFWVQHALWGLNPFPYHLVNVTLHAVCGLLLWRTLDRLNVRGAWLGSALWALHPVQVESVAWITELKNTQSCLFYLLAIWFFLNWRRIRSQPERPGGMLDYVLALLCALLAILSKSSTAMLPVVLGLCWWWIDGRWRWRNLPALIPFLLVSLAASLWTIWEQKFHAGALGTYWTQTWPERIIIAGLDVWFYLGRLVWPYPLIFIYPRWNVDALQPLQYLPIFSLSVGMLVLWWKRNEKARPLFFAAAYFIVSLFPVLGFFNVYFFRFSFVGDHFQYLASMGPLALAAAGIVTAMDSVASRKRFLEPVVCAFLLFILGTLTWRQCGMYADVETLWRTTISKNPNSWLAHNNLGDALMERGKSEEAIVHYKKVLELLPDDPYSHDNLGRALLQNGAIDEAIAEYRKALQLRAGDPEAHNNLGLALIRQGLTEQAIPQFQKALELRSKPAFISLLSSSQRAIAGRHDAEIGVNLGNAFLKNGQVDEAIASYKRSLQLRSDDPDVHGSLANAFLQKDLVSNAVAEDEQALRLRPNDPELHNNLGSALLRQGLAEQAIAHFTRALELLPVRDDRHRAEIHYNLGNLLLQKRQIEDAIAHYKKAIEMRPDYPEAHSNLGIAFQLKGQLDLAVTEYEKTLEIAPQSVATRNNLARLLAASPDLSLRDGTRAVQIALQAVKLSGGKDPVIFRTLAAAYAESGQFSEAVGAAEKAIQLSLGEDDSSFVNGVREEIKSYEAHQRPAH